MAWCETVEYGKGPCKGCANQARMDVEAGDKNEQSSTEINISKSFEAETQDDEEESDLSDFGDEENKASDNYVEDARELGIIDEAYDGPKSPLEAASMITSHKLSTETFGWRSGGASVQYRYSERGGLVNNSGYARFFLDRVNSDGSIMVRYAIMLILYFTNYFLNFRSRIYLDTLSSTDFAFIQKRGRVRHNWSTAIAKFCPTFW